MGTIRYLVIVFICFMFQSCGGSGSSSDPSASSVSPSSTVAVASSSQSSMALSSSASSSSSSVPDWFPKGTVEKLPVLTLNTDGAAPIVSKEIYLPGSFTLQEDGGTSASGTTEVRGRGNSTWDWPKKPYRMKLTNSTSLLGMPANKNWVLLANYADKTLMRNDVAFMFSESLGMEYTPRSKYVELNLNGTYQGVYQLTEHIRIAKDRVNIPELKVADIDADKISGGYLLEVDFRHNKDFCLDPATQAYATNCSGSVNTLRNVDYCVDSTHGMEPFCLSNPETLLDPTWSAQKNYIEKYITDTEAALFGADFKDPTLGYAAYLDVDSVINYYLINEIFKNVDGTASSFYMYKKRGGKLFFGPIWDFDLSMGNAGYNDVEKTSGWHIRKASWYARLFEDPAFEAKVKQRWATLKTEGKLQQILDYARARATWLDQQQAKNYTIWSVTDVVGWVQHISLGSYAAEVNQAILWQRARINWMDSQFNYLER